MDERGKSLSESLQRMQNALQPPAPRAPSGPGEAVTAMGVLAAVLFAAGLKSGNWWFLIVAVSLAIVAGAMWVKRAMPDALQKLQGGPISQDRPHIGMGASVASTAVVEPGASVEMGASIGRGAVVRSGAVVRMGASVGRGAIIERGAVVSWGADVQRDARVGERAVVGAGSSVKRGAHVPAGTRLFPGTDFRGGAALPAVPAPPAQAAASDPRLLRTAAVCDKLEAELRASPEQVRAFLGGSDQTLASLRRTCEDLLKREAALRSELDESAAAHLEEERAGLQKRLGAEPDAQIRSSLQGALAAMDEVKRQRELLRVGADRLQAEHTRLLYTLEALASQFVRLRSAGHDARAAAELESSIAQLRAELDAITDALEQVTEIRGHHTHFDASDGPAKGNEDGVPESPGGIDIRHRD
jgi:carbonic anhydrase/acetyltransferase-like protein (isoleucine patch superfamily)